VPPAGMMGCMGGEEFKAASRQAARWLCYVTAAGLLALILAADVMVAAVLGQ